MFFKEVNEENLGDTSIANIFIDIFMPMADGLYVKVYLLAYRNACNPDLNPNFSNKSIAKDLNIPLSDVILSWRFWESKGLVKMHKNDGPVSYTHLTLPTIPFECRSRWSPYH